MFFLKNALQDKNIAAFASSSQFVIQRVVNDITNQPLLIIEHGGGTGVMTKALLKKLSPFGKLIVIESNTEFVKKLHAINDSRLEIFSGTVQEFYTTHIHDLREVDYIISSIPFSFLSIADRDMIVEKSYNALSKNGNLTIFHQYSWLMRKDMCRYFNGVTLRVEPLNFFPCFILSANK